MPKGHRLRWRSDDPVDDVAEAASWGSWDLAFDSLLGAIVSIIAFVVIVLVITTVLFPLLALTLDLVLLIIVFTAGAIGRLIFGRPWRIEAKTLGAPHRTREIHAKGLRGSREAIDELAAEIAAGR